MRSIDRSMIFSTLSEHEIVRNYRALYRLDSSIGLAEIRRHAGLEGILTDRLLASTPENRWEEFAQGYGRLYAELPWLNAAETARVKSHEPWAKLIGTGKTVLEIGSGRGELARFLAGKGNICHATEITPERGSKFVELESGVIWELTDGVHLSRFVPEAYFDFVISDQVFEHLHPDDHLTHLAEARRVIKPGGCYILRTPHPSTGPHDLSQVFGVEAPLFMHLHEPSYAYLGDMLKRAGYAKTMAVLVSGQLGICRLSSGFLTYQILADRIEAATTSSRPGTRAFRRHARPALVRTATWVAGQR